MRRPFLQLRSVCRLAAQKQQDSSTDKHGAVDSKEGCVVKAPAGSRNASVAHRAQHSNFKPKLPPSRDERAPPRAVPTRAAEAVDVGLSYRPCPALGALGPLRAAAEKSLMRAMRKARASKRGLVAQRALAQPGAITGA